MYLLLTDGDVEITSEWLTGKFAEALRAADFDAVEVYTPLGFIALGERATLTAQLDALTQVRLTETWTVEKLIMLKSMIDDLTARLQ